MRMERYIRARVRLVLVAADLDLDSRWFDSNWIQTNPCWVQP